MDIFGRLGDALSSIPGRYSPLSGDSFTKQFGGFLGGTEGGFERTPALEPYQEDVYRQLLNTFSDRVGQPGERYEGDFTPEPTDAQRRAESELTSMLSGDNQVGETLRRYMGGEPSMDVSPEATQRYFEQNVQQPMQEQLENTQDEIGEQYAGSGTYWGSARARAQQEATQDTQDEMSRQLSELQRQDRQLQADLSESAAERAMGAAQAYGSQQTDLARTLSDMGAQQQQLTQRGLEQAYQDYVRTRPEEQPYMDAVMQMLQVPTQHVAYQEGQRGALPDLAQLASTFMMGG